MPKEQENLAPPLVEPPKPKYNLYTVKKGEIMDQQTGGGTFVPLNEYYLSFKDNAGRLKEINVKMGDFVKAGDVLARLDVEDLEYNVSQMEIDLVRDELSFEKLLMDYENLKKELSKAKQAVDEAIDKEAVEKAQERVESVELQIKKAEKDIEIYKLNMEKKRMDYDRAKEKLEAAQMRSPVDGIVSSVSRVRVGDWINAYTNIISVIDPSVIYLKYVPLTGLSRYEVGMEAIVTIGQKNYHGTIVMVPKSLDEINVDERLRDSVLIAVDDLPEDVKYGDTASITFIFDKKEDVIVIPKAGLRTYGDRSYVVVMKDGVSREKDVEVGMQTPTLIEITAGLEEGEEIILQ